ncbi:hypothetical protein AEAC466_04490 [Asticcacaulis sp. AC466]|uniref:hypothetical protein n=1 Tax=Asticcacaulis sp. AC466 TaxID=1282362 RepID=UPI0003C3ACCC|nr:hypothetical protein [Asticcacaulis sp. AC466]ESQ85427.1 hypothetical protein AEAC466_04490 [Asticcacaulis sp. AC466]
MSVIAKVAVRGVEKQYNLYRVEAYCQAENQLMAQYADPTDEDLLFSRASPSGEMRAKFPEDPHMVEGDQLYVIFTRAPQPRAWHWSKARVQSVTDYGGVTKEVRICSPHSYGRPDLAANELPDFTFKISIDNAGASEQFQPNDADWVVGLYRSSQVTMDQALQLARDARGEPAEELVDESQG